MPNVTDGGGEECDDYDRPRPSRDENQLNTLHGLNEEIGSGPSTV